MYSSAHSYSIRQNTASSIPTTSFASYHRDSVHDEFSSEIHINGYKKLNKCAVESVSLVSLVLLGRSAPSVAESPSSNTSHPLPLEDIRCRRSPVGPPPLTVTPPLPRITRRTAAAGHRLLNRCSATASAPTVAQPLLRCCRESPAVLLALPPWLNRCSAAASAPTVAQPLLRCCRESPAVPPPLPPLPRCCRESPAVPLAISPLLRRS
ncbi:SH3 domain-binding protein 1-like [Rhagoletis pomonella]|uniref:SH3 domain-binding protein 1-like n=1 Tax=Rhagoletis pomonella TaxID=28610 RepID=UPI00177D5ABC|nr:SH3 domain-binding protein 1-like [Rhagoletis pomonella]